MKCREVITPLGEMLGLDIPPTLLALADEVARSSRCSAAVIRSPDRARCQGVRPMSAPLHQAPIFRIHRQVS